MELFEFKGCGLCVEFMYGGVDYEVVFFLFMLRVNLVFFVSFLFELIWLVFCFVIEGNKKIVMMFFFCIVC